VRCLKRRAGPRSGKKLDKTGTEPAITDILYIPTIASLYAKRKKAVRYRSTEYRTEPVVGALP